MRTNYIGVDVAREFPGSVGICVFLPASDRIGEASLDQLRDGHDWRAGSEYYKRPSRRHTAHSLFLIPTSDHWNQHREAFIRLAANINATI